MRKYYTAQEMADMMSVNVETIRRAIKSGRLKAARVGNTYRISERDIHRFYWNMGGGGADEADVPFPTGGDSISVIPFSRQAGITYVNCPVCGLKYNHILSIHTRVPGMESVDIDHAGIRTSPAADGSGARIQMICCCESSHKYAVEFTFSKGQIFTEVTHLEPASSDELKKALPRKSS